MDYNNMATVPSQPETTTTTTVPSQELQDTLDQRLQNVSLEKLRTEAKRGKTSLSLFMGSDPTTCTNVQKWWQVHRTFSGIPLKFNAMKNRENVMYKCHVALVWKSCSTE